MDQPQVPRRQRTALSSAKNITAGPSRGRRHCTALTQNGTECCKLLQHPSHKFCPPHHRENVALYGQYKDTEEHYNQLVEPNGGLDVEQKRTKVALGKKTLELRNQVNHRFFSQHGHNRRHVRWILKLDDEVKALECSLRSEENHGKSLSSPENSEAKTRGSKQENRVYRPLMSPEIPMSALDYLPEDSPAKLIKQAMLTMSEGLVARLYSIAPSLNDSVEALGQLGCETRAEPDKGDHVIRFVFRELLLWGADTETLARANKTKSIDTFLKECFPHELQDYIKFFEVLGEENTLHFLRDAVCDYLLSPGASSTVILGGVVAAEDKRRRMTIEGWDILYSYFADVVNWYNGARDGEPKWLDKENDVSQECPLAVLQGFIGITKGYSATPIAPITTEDGIITERRCRCYLTGRMAKNESLARSLIAELVKRVARYIIIVYDMESDVYGSRELVSRSDELDDNPWITRKRSVEVGGYLENNLWTVEWTLKEILSDLEWIQIRKDRNMTKDYYEFIIIERNPVDTFTILDDVADALIHLAGDPSAQEIIDRVAQSLFPEYGQRQLLEAINLGDSSRVDLNIPNVHYEGNRVRSWSVVNDDPGFFHNRSKGSKSDLQITAKIVADMETHGLITSLKTFQPPHTCPTVRRGTDGLEDLYFDYCPEPTDESALYQSPIMSPEISLSAKSLYEFAQAFRESYPDAVFAKGRIHVHYCAWPMPAIKHGDRDIHNFRTVEGHLFRWNVYPFDSPLSPRFWQYYIHRVMNSRLKFVRFVQTTFVVCAKSPEDADANIKKLLAAAIEHNLKLSVPPPSLWTATWKAWIYRRYGKGYVL